MEQNYKELQLQSQYGMIAAKDALEYHLMKEKERILNDFTFPTKPTSDGYYHIYVPTTKSGNTKDGRRAIKAKTLDGLKDKVVKWEKERRGIVDKTFKNLFDAYQEKRVRNVKNGDKALSVRNTMQRDASEYKRFFEGTTFENMLICDISHYDIEAVCEMNMRRYDMKAKAVQSMTAILRGVFRLAEHDGLIIFNPYTKIDLTQYKNLIIPEQDISERMHSDAELQQMLNYLQAYHQRFPMRVPAYALEVQIYTGLRRGEVPALAWSDVKDDYIFIHREQLTVKKGGSVEKEYFQIVEHTKTGRNRFFPITEDVRRCLQALWVIRENCFPDSPYLFPADNNTGVITNNTVYDFYRRMCRQLGINICREVTRGPHSFRRNGITRVINMPGGNSEIASRLYGNTAPVAIKNYYGGVDLETARCLITGVTVGNQR